jgi:hypothetical protein
MEYYEGKGPDALEAVNSMIRDVPNRIDVGEIEFYFHGSPIRETDYKFKSYRSVEFGVTISTRKGSSTSLEPFSSREDIAEATRVELS